VDVGSDSEVEVEGENGLDGCLVVDVIVVAQRQRLEMQCLQHEITV
jgi:hypothetical protein